MGPVFGGELAARGGNFLIGVTAGTASLLGAAWLAFALPSAPPRQVQEPGRRPPIDLTLLRDLPSLRPLVTIAAVAWFSLATLEGTFARLIRHLFGYGQVEFGRLFAYESLLGIVVAAHVLGWIAARVRETPLLRAAYLAQGFGLALNPLAANVAGVVPPLATLFLASTFYAVGAGLANPMVNALCSKLTPNDRQGELFGLLQGSRAIGFILGPIVGGWMFDHHPAAPYFLAGAVCAVAAVLVPARSFEAERPSA
jgi:MFS family permease